MSDQQNAKLRDVVRDVISKIRRYQDRNIGEQNTKASLIEPVLEALGWDVRDADEVFREFKAKSVDSPVDYALTILAQAAALRRSEGAWAKHSRIESGSHKCCAMPPSPGLSGACSGMAMSIASTTRTRPSMPKRSCSAASSSPEDDEGETIKTLTLISRGNMEENLLDVLWNAHYVDRRVKHTLLQLFSTADKSLIRIIRHHEPKLTPKEIIESLRRLDLRFESATPLPAMASPIPAAPTSPTAPGDKPTKRRQESSKGEEALRSLADEHDRKGLSQAAGEALPQVQRQDHGGDASFRWIGRMRREAVSILLHRR